MPTVEITDSVAAERARFLEEVRREIYAVLPGWYVFDGSWAGAAVEAVAPGAVLLAHLPAPDYARGFVARHGGWDGVLEFLDGLDPPVTPLRFPGDSVCLGPPGSGTEGRGLAATEGPTAHSSVSMGLRPFAGWITP